MTMIEALLRDKGSPMGDRKIYNSVNTAMHHLLLPQQITDPASLPACVSLAATIRKLIHCHLSSSEMGSQQLQRNEFGLNKAIVGFMMNWMDSIAAVVESLNVSMHPPKVSNANKDVGSGGRRLPPGGKRATGKVGGNGANVEVIPPASQASFNTSKHQVQCILLAGVVKFAYWRMEQDLALCLPPDNTLGWLQGICCDYHDEKYATNELFGKLMGVSVVPMCRAVAQVGEIMGRHAVEHFHGRLMPGCCHLGCTNMTGVSEASLPTMLCSGCMRTRYCSAKCQKAAWLLGGHSTVCCK